MALLERGSLVEGFTSLLADLDADGRLVHAEHMAARPARTAALAAPAARGGVEQAPRRRAVVAPGRSHRPRARWHRCRRRHRDSVRQVVVLPGSCRGGVLRPDASGYRTARVPDEGACPRPAPRARGARAAWVGRRRVRRRLLARRTHVGAAQRQRRSDEPGDGALRAPAASRALGDVPHAPALRRGRRGARVPRRVRHAHRARAAAAAAGVRVVRGQADVHRRFGDDRRARRAGHVVVEQSCPGRHRRRLAPGRARRSRCAIRCSSTTSECRPTPRLPACSPR